MRSKDIPAEILIAGSVMNARHAASEITNQTIQAIREKWEAIGFNGGLGDSRKLREAIYEIVLANIAGNYVNQGGEP